MPCSLMISALSRLLCGEHDCNLKTIARELGVLLRARGNRIMVKGDDAPARAARSFLQDLYFLIESGFRMQHSDVVHALKIIAHNDPVHLKDVFLDSVVLSSQGTHHNAEKPGAETLC